MSKNRTPDNNAALLRARDKVAANLAPVTDREKQILICMDLLEGRIGTTPFVFGLRLEVAPNNTEGRAPVMVITDMTAECPLQESGLPYRFWMEVSVLYVNPEKKSRWNNPGEEIISRYLHAQPAFAEAKQRLHQEREAVAQAAVANQGQMQEKFLQEMRKGGLSSSVINIDGPLDDSILTRKTGFVFGHEGVAFSLYHVHQTNTMRIRVVACPADHALEAAVQQRTFVRQEDLVIYTGEDNTVVEGTRALPRQVREYLRATLRAMGKYAPVPEQVKVTTMSSDNVEPSTDKVSTLKAKSAATAAPSATEILGVSALPEERTGRRVPAKRVARLNGTRAHL